VDAPILFVFLRHFAALHDEYRDDLTASLMESKGGGARIDLGTLLFCSLENETGENAVSQVVLLSSPKRSRSQTSNQKT
jgi:hypothetical protein